MTVGRLETYYRPLSISIHESISLSSVVKQKYRLLKTEVLYLSDLFQVTSMTVLKESSLREYSITWVFSSFAPVTPEYRTLPP